MAYPLETAKSLFLATAAWAGGVASGFFHMQVRYPMELTVEEYIEQEAWKHAELAHCPFHPDGGCNYAKHGTYPRKFPNYCLVVRYYCPDAQQSISLLPDFFASRLPGTLDEVEHAVNIAEASSSMEEAAFTLRPEVTLPAGLRWLRRRLEYVNEILTILAGLFATSCPPELSAFRKAYKVESVLTRMRCFAENTLQSLPPIVGFGPRSGDRYSPLSPSNN